MTLASSAKNESYWQRVCNYDALFWVQQKLEFWYSVRLLVNNSLQILLTLPVNFNTSSFILCFIHIRIHCYKTAKLENCPIILQHYCTENWNKIHRFLILFSGSPHHHQQRRQKQKNRSLLTWEMNMNVPSVQPHKRKLLILLVNFSSWILLHLEQHKFNISYV